MKINRILIIVFLACVIPVLFLNPILGKLFSFAPQNKSLLIYGIVGLLSVAGLILLSSLKSALPGIAGIKFPLIKGKLGWIVFMSLCWFFPLINPILGNLLKIPGIANVRLVWPSVTQLMLIGLLAPVIEELLFRGCIQGALGGLVPRMIWPAARFDFSVMLMSCLFSLWHFNILQPETITAFPFIIHFLGGVSLGILRNQTGSIWPGVLVHALGNISIICQMPL
jgi:membrane protease YdiL (CAAX protease family)